MTTRLRRLYADFGQSPWLDNLQRGWLADGQLRRMVNRGVRGITSNPTIFAKAMASPLYDEQFSQLRQGGASIKDTYWSLVVSDIGDAMAILRPVYDSSGGADGFVSVEVDPDLAADTAGTVAMARDLRRRIEGPNLFIKVPATAEGIGAIRQLIGEGISVNVTLIFSLQRYGEVMDAYLAGLEAYGGDPSSVASVASFFVSRVDAEIDRRLEAIGTPEALGLRGRTGLANAQVAYDRFQHKFSGPRWAALAARGARVQRPLWASTSTKNPDYPDTMYIDNLIGPDTVNTMPDETLEAFVDHGRLARTIDADPPAATEVLERLVRVGVDLADVTAQLETEGVASFAKSFEQVMATLQSKT